MDSRVIAAIQAERERQRQMWSEDHRWGYGDCSSACVPEPIKSAVLGEECGEVARAVLQGDAGELRTELVHVAAVAIAWLEGMRWD